MVILSAVLGCARPALTTPGPQPVLWDVTVAVASGDRSLTAVYRLRSEPAGNGVWLVSTEHTRGVWEEQGVEHTYDSASPTPRDPWPLTLQHLVASVPAAIRMSDSGAPVALVDPEAWATDARQALYTSELPTEALTSGEALLDPDGLLDDLRRTFPGAPPSGEDWERNEEIAGVRVVRRERCEVAEQGAVRTWACSGVALGPELGPARLHDAETSTRVVADPQGLREVDSSYSGTLVLLDPSGSGVVDRPVAGKRRVERR